MRAIRPANDYGSHRGTALVMWLLAAGCGLFWAQKLLNTAPQASAAPSRRAAAALGNPTANAAALAQLLGGATVTGPSRESTRFSLTGTVVAHPVETPGSSGGGMALISVNGKPARHYRVGQPLDDLYVLQSIGIGSVTLASSTGERTPLTLAMPRPQPAMGRNDRNPPALENAAVPETVRPRPPLSMRFQPFNIPVTP